MTPGPLLPILTSAVASPGILEALPDEWAIAWRLLAAVGGGVGSWALYFAIAIALRVGAAKVRSRAQLTRREAAQRILAARKTPGKADDEEAELYAAAAAERAKGLEAVAKMLEAEAARASRRGPPGGG